MLGNCCQGTQETYFTNCEHKCFFFVYLYAYLWCPAKNDQVKDVNYGEIYFNVQHLKMYPFNVFCTSYKSSDRKCILKRTSYVRVLLFEGDFS
jgi:hypothetical protein